MGFSFYSSSHSRTKKRERKMRDTSFRHVQQSEATIYKNLWPDFQLQDFKEEHGDRITDEKLMVGGSTNERQLLNMATTSLAKMVELHYELKHMHDIERRQVEEIDRARERFKDSENKLHHLTQIREALELSIVELKKELNDSRNESANRLSTMKVRASQIQNEEQSFKNFQSSLQQQFNEAEKKRDAEIEATKQVLEQTIKTKVAGAERGAAALKNVITKCADSLQDACN